MITTPSLSNSSQPSDVAIVIVNYNGWRDTVECLESVFRLTSPVSSVIVCDNGSSDDSIEQLVTWAENRGVVSQGTTGLVGDDFSSLPAPRMIPFKRYTRREAEAGGDVGSDASLVLIECGGNLGFAGGNNVGLRYLLARGEFSSVWLLNNDTVVQPDALDHLVRRLEEVPSAGMCGSTLLYYDRPHRVQALGGGYYCKWLGLAWHQGRFKRANSPINRQRAEHWMNYVVGASLLVRRSFVETVGLLEESYFLYFEEIDWALRGKGRYSLAYAPESVVFHKVGRSIGTNSLSGQKSDLSDYCNVRNRLNFTRRHYPYALPTIYVTLLATMVLRVLSGRRDRAAMIWRLLRNGGNESLPPAVLS